MREKSVKYNSTTEIKIQVFRFGKGDENVNSIVSLYTPVSISLDEKMKVTVRNTFNIKNNISFK